MIEETGLQSPARGVARMEREAAVCGGVVLLTLLLLPAPLLPPHRLAESVRGALGVGWKGAYLIAALGLQVVVHGALGMVAAFAIPRASTRSRRWLQLTFVPLGVVAGALLIRSVKLGHLPLLANAIVPLIACLGGVALGLLFRQYGWRVAVGASGIALAGLGWALFPDVSSGLSQGTEAQLQRLVAKAAEPPAGEKQLGILLQTVFAPPSGTPAQASVTEHNRAAILALGIAIGHERLARFAGLNRHDDLVRTAMSLRQRVTLHGRGDWARHFCLSAALTVLENPFLSDAGGLIKEELDALTKGTGFSFGDLAADRAGVRFAQAATDTEAAAQAIRVRLQSGFAEADYFPAASDLPENLTVEQFRRDYGGVGDGRYRRKVREIEARLDRCPGLSP